MQQIFIENFGPIRRFAAEVQDIILLIGPQASGKSTISKSIFLFKSIKDELYNFISLDLDKYENPVNEFAQYIGNRFVRNLGAARNIDPPRIKYDYSNEITITFLRTDQGKINVQFSTYLSHQLEVIFQDVRNYNEKNSTSTSSTLEKLLELDSEKRAYLKMLKSRIDDLFKDRRSQVFIPSGRSLMSILADQLQDIKNPHILDLFTKSFVERINLLKPYFIGDLNGQIEFLEEFLLQGKAYLAEARYAADLIKKILKGKYIFQSDEERIYINDDKFIKLQYASSGQQESIWILLLIFRYIIDQTSVSVVFEEPEAHLYPETQSDMVDLIGLLANLNKNQIIITTHSPYILSSFNNLIYAHQVGTKKEGYDQENVEKIVNKKSWLAPNRVAAYFIGEDDYESIIDEELQLIKAEKIDSASGIINNKFNDLFNLDD